MSSNNDKLNQNHIEKEFIAKEPYKSSFSKKEHSNKNKNLSNKSYIQKLNFNKFNKDIKSEILIPNTEKDYEEDNFINYINEEVEKDPIKYQISELLSIITKDNYKNTADQIYEIIEKDIEKQVKFIDLLFNKFMCEKSKIDLYAKLCKDFNKKLPQKAPIKEEKNNDNPKKSNSVMRTKILDRCRDIFKTERNEKYEEYFKIKDKEERDMKLKNYILGNTNFIGELINIHILSKKLVKQFLNNLFEIFCDKNSDESLKMINLEGVVLLLDKFGTFLKEREKKIKEDDKITFNKMFDEYLKKLSEILNNKDIHIETSVKFKIINLINKSKNNWEKTRFEINIEEEELNKIGNIKTTNGLYTQEEINKEISRDLNYFKDHILYNGTPSDYNWKIIDNIYENCGNSFNNIFHGFLFSCLDFVQDKETLNIVNDYFHEIIFYYKNSLSQKERKEIVEKINQLLRVAKDWSLINLLILDVWRIILSNLIRYHLFRRDDLIELKDMDEENIKTVFVIIAKSIKEDPESKIHYDKCKFVSLNKMIYDEAMKEVFQ